LLILKNFYLNPNQPLNSLFNLKYINLGDFKSLVFNNNINNKILIEIELENGVHAHYEITKDEMSIHLTIFLENKTTPLKLSASFSMPYPMNQIFPHQFENIEIDFNGITANVRVNNVSGQFVHQSELVNIISKKINSIAEFFKNNIDIVPQRRGFFKPIYSPMNINVSYLWDEDEVATWIINQPELQQRISMDLERICNREFRIYTPPGSPLCEFRVADKVSGTPALLVNEGFGVNQLVYLLSKVEQQDKIILIEEPEIHLHPELVQKFAHLLVKLVKDNNNQFFITTHHELMVISLLNKVKKQEVDADEIKCFWMNKKDRQSEIIEQKVNNKGQIEGGLENFISPYVEDLLEK